MTTEIIEVSLLEVFVKVFVAFIFGFIIGYLVKGSGEKQGVGR